MNNSEGRENSPHGMGETNTGADSSQKEEEVKEETHVPRALRESGEFKELKERTEYMKALKEKLNEVKKHLNSLIGLYDGKVSKEQQIIEVFSSLFRELLGMHDDLYEGFGKKLEEGSPIARDLNYLSMEKLKDIEQQIEGAESSIADVETRLRTAIDNIES